MAEDNGAGPLGPFGALSLVPGVGGAVAAAAGAVGNLLVELGEMDNFKKRVDELLIEFNKSPAAHDKVGEDRLTQSSLGGTGFKEAEFLHASYNVVHEELQNLSKTLGLQIESMTLAIHASQTGYQNIDDDIRARMQKLNAEIEARYDESRDPGKDSGNRNSSPQSQTGAGAVGKGQA
ncbi:hypothetical protein ACWF94_11845 [Streptomyces sp. NPDC055078]